VAAIATFARTLAEHQDEDDSAVETAKPKNLRERVLAWAVVLLGIDTASNKRKRNLSETAAQGSNKEREIMMLKPWYVVRHSSRAYIRFHHLFLACVTWDTLMLPVQLCFISLVAKLSWFESVLIFVDVIYWVRMAVCFNTTYVNENSVVIVKPGLIRRNYLATGCLFDLLAAFPLDHFALLLGAEPYVYSLLRLLRVINVRYIRNAYLKWTKSLADDDLLIGLVHYLTILMLAAHFLACIWNFLGYGAYTHEEDKRVWPSQFAYAIEQLGVAPDLPSLETGASAEATLGNHYLVALYYVMAMLTTLGSTQGPSNYAEVIFFIMTMVANLTVHAGAGSASRPPPAPRARACATALALPIACCPSGPPVPPVPRGAPRKR
jgi:hypothetical protein